MCSPSSILRPIRPIIAQIIVPRPTIDVANSYVALSGETERCSGMTTIL